MITTNPLPKLITFDGEARSGKGTIVQRVKDSLRDEHGYKVMLIDAGQVFRCLVVAATNRTIDLDDPDAIDAFLGDEKSSESCVGFVKAVYHMEKIDRDALLYTNEVGVNSAKIGARPLSQAFKDQLLEKWLRDARAEGYEIVLLDGRALEEVGTQLEAQGLCEFVLGMYFVCDAGVGAMRTLGIAYKDYDDLAVDERAAVDEMIGQINERNRADRERAVQPIRPPKSTSMLLLPEGVKTAVPDAPAFMIIDTSASMTKDEMSAPVTELCMRALTSDSPLTNT